jgi:ABC-2 type transport system permease protein
MGPWRLELIRTWRTRRMIVLLAAFVIVGLGDPVLTYLLPRLVNRGPRDGVHVILPRQTALDAVTGVAGSLAELGTLVVAIVAAATLVFDGRPALAAFYRTRLRRPVRLVLPRYLVLTAAALVALAAGTLAAWYETTVLFGAVPAGGLAAGFGLEALWFCFVTSLVVAFASVVRSAGAAVGSAIAVLLALALLGSVTVISSWLPTRLSASLPDLISRGSADDIWHAVIVAAAAAVVLVVAGVWRLGRREL